MNLLSLPIKNNDIQYLECLVSQIGLSKYKLSKLLKIDYSYFCSYFRNKNMKSAQNMPYHTQLVLEFLAKGYNL